MKNIDFFLIIFGFFATCAVTYGQDFPLTRIAVLKFFGSPTASIVIIAFVKFSIVFIASKFIILMKTTVFHMLAIIISFCLIPK